MKRKKNNGGKRNLTAATGSPRGAGGSNQSRGSKNRKPTVGQPLKSHQEYGIPMNAATDRKDEILPGRMEWGARIAVLSLVVAAPFVAEGTSEEFSNWIPVLLWILLGAVTIFYRVFQGQKIICLNAVDLCLVAVITWVTASGLFAIIFGTGHDRPTINATWQWINYLIVFFVIRQWLNQPGIREAVIIALVSLAIGSSTAAIYQRYVVKPLQWQEYKSKTETEKQQILRQSGLTQVESDTRERLNYESRLYATSPTSTFILTNSLAAYLTPWLVIMTFLFLRVLQRGKRRLQVIPAVGTAVILFALLLTNSRTSYLAAFLGSMAMLLVLLKTARSASCHWMLGWKLWGCLALGLAALTGLGFMVGAVDIQTISEAGKSLSYRFEYWQATLAMIQDEWLFGCGPGNFQHAYAKYQLAEASETVSDPHNFLFEIGAIAGTPALIFCMAGCFFWIRRQWSNWRDLRSKSEIAMEIGENKVSFEDTSHIHWFVVSSLTIGTLIAIIINLLVSASPDLSLITGITAIATWVGLFRWRKEIEGSTVLAIALMAFAVALSASGGVGFPSVAMTGLVLLGLTSGSPHIISSERRAPNDPDSRGIVLLRGRAGQGFQLGVLVLTLLAAFGFRMTVIDPIQNGKKNAVIGEMEAVNGNLEAAIRRLDLAIKSDPYDANYLFFKLQILYGKFLNQPSEDLLDSLEDLSVELAAARPRNSRVTLETAKIFLSILVRNTNLKLKMKSKIEKLACRFLAESTDRRPQDAYHAAFRCFGYELTGDSQNAKKWAIRALELDEKNPHQDKALRNGPFRLEGYESGSNIEQILVEIRKR